jgi:flagellar M-ring protein FliF
MPASLSSLLTNLTPKGKAILAGSAIGLVALLFFGMQLAGRPSYTLLSTGIDPAQTGKLTAALDAKGVGYELRNNGTALAVEKAQVGTARIALAEQGISASGTGKQPGFELFDKQKLGASDFQQQVTYQRALEGQVSSTIEQVQGVNGASVRLVLPEDELFSDTATPATAAVLLSGSSDALDPGAVRGIAQLVSSSVKGLKTDKVSITDGTGTLLWPRGGDGAAGGVATKQAVQARYEQQVESNLTAMLARTVGQGKAEVQVAADLNADQATKDELVYADKGTPLSTKTETENLRGGGAGGGAAGTASNIPTYAQGAAGANSNYRRQTEDTDFGVNKTVTRTKVAPGAVNRLDVALMIDKSVPAADVAGIQAAVAGAAGIQRGRGDTLAVSRVAFAKVSEPAAPGAGPAAMLGYAKYVAAALGLLAFLFLMTRHLRRREEETLLREPRWLREIEAPTALAELERAGASGTAEVTLPERQDHPARRQVEALAAREPERVAQQIRTWMRDS